MTETKIAIFRNKKIRKTIYNNEWWFVVEDVVVVLTDSSNPKDYINKMRRRDNELSKGYGQIVHTLSVETVGGPQRMNCANTEGIFRIIQSVPSPKAEPFLNSCFFLPPISSFLPLCHSRESGNPEPVAYV